MINKLKNKQVLTGYLFAVMATAIWSANFTVARLLNDALPPVTIAFWRWVVAIAVLFPFALNTLKAEWCIVKMHIPYLSVIGVLGITIFNTLIYFAAHTSTAINLSLISICSPIFIIIFSRLYLRELITLNRGLGILLVVSGVLLLITGGDVQKILHLTFTVGDLWMLLAAVSFALYSMILKHKPQGLSITTLQLCSFILGVTFLTPFYIWESSVTPHIEITNQITLAILYVGLGASLIGYLSWNKAITKIGPSRAGIVYYTMPLFSAVFAHTIIGETVNYIHLISAIMIISGIVTANYISKRSIAIVTETSR